MQFHFFRSSLAIVSSTIFFSTTLLAPEASAQVGKRGVSKPAKSAAALSRPSLKSQPQPFQPAAPTGPAVTELDLGWKAALEWQAAEALQHFNKAAAAGEKGYRLAWGYGLAYGQLSKFPESIRWYERAVEQYGSNGRLHSDFGYSYMSWGIYTARMGKKPQDQMDAQRYIEAAEAHFQDAARLSPTDSANFTRLATLSYYRGKYAQAWKYVIQSKKLGGEELDERFVKDLSQRMPAPK